MLTAHGRTRESGCGRIEDVLWLLLMGQAAKILCPKILTTGRLFVSAVFAVSLSVAELCLRYAFGLSVGRPFRAQELVTRAGN